MSPLVLTFLLLVSSQALTCDKGGLVCEENTCHYPLYIEGCSTYATDNSCAQCEFSIFTFTQTTSFKTDSATIPGKLNLSLVVLSSIAIVYALSALLDFSSIQPVISVRTSKSMAACKKTEMDAKSALTVFHKSFRLRPRWWIMRLFHHRLHDIRCPETMHPLQQHFLHFGLRVLPACNSDQQYFKLQISKRFRLWRM